MSLPEKRAALFALVALFLGLWTSSPRTALPVWAGKDAPAPSKARSQVKLSKAKARPSKATAAKQTGQASAKAANASNAANAANASKAANASNAAKAANASNASNIAKSAQAPEKKTDQSWCSRLNQGGLRGAFRELSCLIYFRRSHKRRFHPLDKLLWKKYTALYKRVQKLPSDWEVISRWQALYVLGTRLYPTLNKWAHHAEIPVYEVNGHHKALPYWIKEGLRRDVGPLLHFDTHSDMRMVFTSRSLKQAVVDLKHNRNTKEAWHTIAHSVDECAKPVTGAVVSGTYNNVIWARPGWHQTPLFVQQRFFYGIYTPLMSRPKDPNILHPFYHLQPGFTQLFYDPDQSPKRPKIAKTLGPWIPLKPDLKPASRHFREITPFQFSIVRTDKPIDAQGKGQGAPELKKLLAALPPGPFTLDLDLDYFASIDSTDGFRRPHTRRTKWMEFSDFEKQRKFVKERLENFRNLLLVLRAKKRIPALITIADSTFINFAYDKVAEGDLEYTPIEHAAYLRYRVRQILREVYGDKVMGRKRPKPSTTASLLEPRGKAAQCSAIPKRRCLPPDPQRACVALGKTQSSGTSTL